MSLNNEFTKEQIDKALEEISKMNHMTMARLWRFTPTGANDLYLRFDLPTGQAFSDRLFKHFGGFTPDLSKTIGW